MGREKYLLGAAFISLLACVGDSNAVTDAGTDATQDGTTPSDASPDVTNDANDAGPTCTHACATGYTCLPNGHCGNDVAEVSMGADISCAVLYVGELWCWGDNTYGQMGVPAGAAIPTPQKVAGVPNAAHVAGFDKAVCAADTSGAVYCWGANDYGQLGHGVGQQGDTTCSTKACNYVPKSVGGFPGGTKVVQLSMGNTYVNSDGVTQSQVVCARADNGKAYCWGANGLGAAAQPLAQLTIASASEVPGLSSVTDISAVFTSHVCAVAGGQVYCWGWNGIGQLGHAPNTAGDQTNAPCLSLAYCNNAPVAVVGLTNVNSTAGGSHFSCASLADAGVSCWGSNEEGNLGDGKLASIVATLPAAVVSPLPSNIVRLQSHYSTTYAIDATGAVWAWGDNTYGEFGVGNLSGPSCTTYPCNSTPQKLTTLSKVIEVSLGAYDLGAVTADGQLYTWGIGTHGTGDMSCNSQTCNPTPLLFTGLPH